MGSVKKLKRTWKVGNLVYFETLFAALLFIKSMLFLPRNVFISNNLFYIFSQNSYISKINMLGSGKGGGGGRSILIYRNQMKPFYLPSPHKFSILNFICMYTIVHHNSINLIFISRQFWETCTTNHGREV